ncbi:hypothetical protein L249_1350 [Ophiocordyceps polyrhachis-furcata BCC 54312]|uniref:Uncharacterized protein n=1 Tax=Ophiocordyceps polyrhachis-furcata BCC 54312 TaxID=1330021 RepID=A0A367LCR1_9HYPO|nr:hypothetical protein L249_1350 [Ophiocordyceps polyrhachis-furcata BCC 54312]
MAYRDSLTHSLTHRQALNTKGKEEGEASIEEKKNPAWEPNPFKGGKGQHQRVFLSHRHSAIVTGNPPAEQSVDAMDFTHPIHPVGADISGNEAVNNNNNNNNNSQREDDVSPSARNQIDTALFSGGIKWQDGIETETDKLDSEMTRIDEKKMMASSVELYQSFQGENPQISPPPSTPP